MQTKVIEATQDHKTGFNWGKMLVGRFDSEWEVQTTIGAGSLLSNCGWSPEHILVMDLQTGEGAIFRPGGLASADLNKHRVWVCVLFEAFLEWLYQQDLRDLEALPALVELPDVSPAFSGYRRAGICPVHETTYQDGPGGLYCEGCLEAGSQLVATGTV